MGKTETKTYLLEEVSGLGRLIRLVMIIRINNELIYLHVCRGLIPIQVNISSTNTQTLLFKLLLFAALGKANPLIPTATLHKFDLDL